MGAILNWIAFILKGGKMPDYLITILTTKTTTTKYHAKADNEKEALLNRKNLKPMSSDSSSNHQIVSIKVFNDIDTSPNGAD